MFERFTRTSRTAVVLAQEVARDRGDRRIAPEHLLLSLLQGDAGARLRNHGATPEDVAAALDTAPGDSGRATPADDAEMLAALGIDVQAIRQAVEANFGEGALDRDLGGSPSRRGDALAWLTRGRRGRDRTGRTGRTPQAHIPFSPAAKKTLELSLREAIRLGDREIAADHLLLGLLRVADPRVLLALDATGVDPAGLRAEIERDRRRSA